MAKNLTIVLTLLAITFLFSCGNGKSNHNENVKQETPKALQDDKLEIKSYGRSNDLTEELYAELVDKSSELKKLENDLNAFKLKPNELFEQFNKFDSKSNSYYVSSDLKVNSISDSLLRKQMLSLISKSRNQYSNKVTELNTLIKLISQKGYTINDHYKVLKIMLTLPIIEKFQMENLPNKNEFEQVLKQQQNLIQQVDSLVPGFK